MPERLLSSLTGVFWSTSLFPAWSLEIYAVRLNVPKRMQNIILWPMIHSLCHLMKKNMLFSNVKAHFADFYMYLSAYCHVFTIRHCSGMSAMWNLLSGVKFGYIEKCCCALRPWCMPSFYLLLGSMVKIFYYSCGWIKFPHNKWIIKMFK